MLKRRGKIVLNEKAVFLPLLHLLILTAWVLELKSVAISFRGLPERLRSETVPVSSYRFLVEETHFGDTPNNLAISFYFLSQIFSRPTIYHFCGLFLLHSIFHK
ncbi:hypothetical protein BpHYR1_050167 [Brachionus plicatilis]|uniref:Uncharacterized protein n=1 Tax=Brachionus plicatilis TaxID=10195 RepID=A0A3M7PIV7_BRAPC|nr:hypothetical protein BpHYR1_050167 [Brachionus plicatilis]